MGWWFDFWVVLGVGFDVEWFPVCIVVLLVAIDFVASWLGFGGFCCPGMCGGFDCGWVLDCSG